MKHRECDLMKIIPKEEIDRVFSESKTASGDMDYTFLCFEDSYKALAEVIPKDYTVIDLGCAYAPQSYYFKDHKEYIGVDIRLPDAFFNNSGNSGFTSMSIQEFCRNYRYGFFGDKVFAICQYVPDIEAQQMVRETFENCFVYYP